MTHNTAKTSEPVWDSRNGDEWENLIALPNDTKIRFCNAFNSVEGHYTKCRACWGYIKFGDGDLCAKGKDLIARELVFADTSLTMQGEGR